MTRICIVPAVQGIGGMASFRQKFEAGLEGRGIAVTHNPDDACDAVLVIAGTRYLLPLSRARRRGVRVVQRLDGINWIHRRRRTGLRHYLRAEYGNLVLRLIRSRIATQIVYQSEFTHLWWDEWYGRTEASFSVIHNGVDLTEYQPGGLSRPPEAPKRLLVVEGNLGGGYDMGLDHALELAQILTSQYGLPMELMVVGKVTEQHRANVAARTAQPILWAGVVPRDRIPEIDRSADILYSADLNPACPNSVIESLACGLPVVGFDTGALKELVVGDSGRIVPYGGNPWRLDKPDIPSLAEAATEILRDRPRFSHTARAHAEKALGIQLMLEGYLKALLED